MAWRVLEGTDVATSDVDLKATPDTLIRADMDQQDYFNELHRIRAYYNALADGEVIQNRAFGHNPCTSLQKWGCQGARNRDTVPINSRMPRYLDYTNPPTVVEPTPDEIVRESDIANKDTFATELVDLTQDIIDNTYIDSGTLEPIPTKEILKEDEIIYGDYLELLDNTINSLKTLFEGYDSKFTNNRCNVSCQVTCQTTCQGQCQNYTCNHCHDRHCGSLG